MKDVLLMMHRRTMMTNRLKEVFQLQKWIRHFRFLFRLEGQLFRRIIIWLILSNKRE